MLVDDDGRVQLTPSIRERIYFMASGNGEQTNFEIHISAALK